jgi:cytochrome b
MSEPIKVRIWDAPTRLFHWSLVLLVCFSWLTVQLFWMQLHYLSGEAILTLLLFRIVWGFVGSDTARFGQFLKSPFAAIAHLRHIRRREPDTELGHNAAGGWMVLGLLGLLLLQVGTGLFSSDDDAAVEGPLRHLVSANTSTLLTDLHGFVFTAIQIAVALHVLALLLYYVFKGQNLVRPMITGAKSIENPSVEPRMVHPVRAVAVLCAAAVLVAALVRFF